MAWDWQAKTREQLGPLAVLAVLACALPMFTPAASAQSPVSGLSSLGGKNSKQPIDIESDRLEVDDKNHVAIFIGNVSATQGDNNLKAPRLEVTYESASQAHAGAPGAKAAKPVKVANASADADPVSSGQIKYIHALGGKVTVTNKKDQEEATGDDAVYDVKSQKITMTGKEVVLTQKKSVIKGSKLLINLATGQAIVIPDEDTAHGKVHGRVRAVLETEGKGGLPGFGDIKKKGESASPSSDKQAAPQNRWQTQSR